jgi:DNA-directed RNA polymerase I subunit RPA2
VHNWKACHFCGAGSTEQTDTIALVEIPQVLRLWAAELTSIGIRVALNVSSTGQ